MLTTFLTAQGQSELSKSNNAIRTNNFIVDKGCHVDGISIPALVLSDMFFLCFFFSNQNQHKNDYCKQTMYTSYFFRALIFLVFGIGAAPIGLCVACALACAVFLAFFFLPILLGPISFCLYVTFLAYVLWNFIRVFLNFGDSLQAFIKQSFRRCMGWLCKNTQRVPISNSSELSLLEPVDEEDSDQNEENVQTSLSDEDHEQTTHGDVRQFNVPSVRQTLW